MLVYETPPTDGDLQQFVDPQRAPPYVDLDDDGTALTGRPKPFPMWFVWVCLLFPAAVAVGTLVWMNPFADPDPLVRLWGYLAAFMTPASVAGCRLLVGAIIRAETRMDTFFVLDRAAGTLLLPRVGVTLRRGDVVEVVEVRSTYTVRDDEGTSGERRGELSVLARRPDGTIVRYSVLAAGHAKPVARVAEVLAEVFGVPRRKLVEGVCFGGWRRVD